MIDDVYQAALAALKQHLDAAGADYQLDEGELIIGEHRLGLSIAFDGYVPQGELTLAPLDIQIHLDGDQGDRFRVGALGVGPDAAAATSDAIAEWHTLAAWPLMSALGAGVEKRRAGETQSVAGWDMFAGRVGIRGQVPPALRGGAPFFQSLVERLRQVVAKWEQPSMLTLRTIYLMVTCSSAATEVQAAVDGMVDPELASLVQGLPWPSSSEPYLYKQLFVFRYQPAQ
ncbi:MAG: hypothetical protein DWQ37_08600 [Planctomycetota bacterium]|nr:MAG: hypothetical protein DWQ37_08600 [Planctomycetota bacterium]